MKSKAEVHYLNFSKNTNSNAISGISHSIENTSANVVNIVSKEKTTTLTEENNKKALDSKVIHRFSISQGGVNKIEKIGLSIDEVENSELPTIEEVAKEKYINECLGGLDSSDFNISEEIEFTLLGLEGESGFIAEKGTILKEM